MGGQRSGVAAITRERLQAEALSRAMHGQATSNLAAIVDGFKAMGIAEADISPRENVFTFWAWKALGRQVRKGEHGVRVTTWVESRKALRSDARDRQSDVADDGTEASTRSRLARPVTVFHISQSEPVSGVPPRRESSP